MYTAFIVDDEPYVRARLREMIPWEELGFSIAGEASDGEEAHRAILSLKPDLVLTDIRIPVFSGLELIRRSIPELPRCRFILLSGYSDFEYAREAIKYGVKSYLLKPIGEAELRTALWDVKGELGNDRERESILNKGMAALQEKWCGDVLHGLNPSSYLSRAAELKIPLQDRRFTVMIVDWKEDETAAQEEPEGLEGNSPLRNALIRRAADEALLPYGSYFMIADEHERYMILHLSPSCKVDSEIDPKEMADKLWERCSGILDGHVTIGFGGTTDSLFETEGCCTEAKLAVEGKFVLGRNRVISFREVAGNGGAGNWSKLAAFKGDALLEAVQSLDLKAMRQESTKLFMVLRGLSYDPSLTRNMLIENMVGLLRILIRINGDVGEVFGRDFRLDDWLDQYTLDELESEFYGCCVKIAEYIAAAQKNRPGKVVEQMLAYIHDHYAEEITLKSISRIFYMNPVYLGQLFKNEMNVGYNHYLTEIRIKAAKKMLDGTDWSVSDIADKVGYKVNRNFYIAFKKYAGSTPNEYRGRNKHFTGT